MNDLIKEVRDCVEASEAAYRTWRKEGRETLLMKAGVREAHWPGDTAAQRDAEGLPVLVVNELPQFSNRVVGAFRMNQFAISLTGGDNVNDPRSAETQEGLIRAICYDSIAKVAYRYALQNSVDTGLGWLRVAREYEAWDAWDQVLRVLPVYNTFSVYPDATALRFDLDDCPRLSVLEEMQISVFSQRWKGASVKDLDAGTGNAKRRWSNQQDKTVTIAEYWRKRPVKKTFALIGDPERPDLWETIEVTKEVEAQFYQEGDQLFLVQEDAGGPEGPGSLLVPIIRTRKADTHQLEVGIFSGAEELEKMKPEPGRYFPFVQVLGEDVHIDGERRLWGVLQNAKDPQRVGNYQWSAAVEAVGMGAKAPYILTADEIEGFADMWAASNRQRSPYLLFKPDPKAPGRPQRQPPVVTPVAALALVEKSEQMKNSVTGVNAESMGEQTNAKSGVAIRQRQEIGTVNTATYPDNLTLAMEHLARILLERIPYVYDNERTIRILGPDYLKYASIRVNGSGGPDITKGRYDIIAKIGPAYATRQEQEFTRLTEFGKGMGEEGFTLLADKIANSSDLPQKEELVDRIKAIQARMGFSEDGAPPPQMTDAIMQQIMQALPQMVGGVLEQMMAQKPPADGNGEEAPGMMG